MEVSSLKLFLTHYYYISGDAMELLSRKLENWKDFCKMIHFQEEEIYPSEYQIQCMTKAVEENKGLSDSICVLLQA